LSTAGHSSRCQRLDPWGEPGRCRTRILCVLRVAYTLSDFTPIVIGRGKLWTAANEHSADASRSTQAACGEWHGRSSAPRKKKDTCLGRREPRFVDRPTVLHPIFFSASATAISGGMLAATSGAIIRRMPWPFICRATLQISDSFSQVFHHFAARPLQS